MEIESLRQKVYKRKILPLERIFLRGPAASISLVARVNGFISEDRFRAAVEKVAKTHPLLSVRVHFNEKQEAYFTSIDAPEFPIKFCQRESDRQWFQEIKEQHRIPFNVEEGPLIRFILLNSQQISEFVIFCEHIICDGMSLAYLVKHMLQHLGDPAKEPDPRMEPPDLSQYNHPVRTSPRFMVRMAMNKFNKAWEKEKVLFDFEDFKCVHKVFWDNYSYSIIPLELTEEETSDLVSLCRENGVTVNNALCSAFMAARLEVRGSKGLKPNVVVPVNIRNRLKKPAGEAFGLCAGGIKFKYKYNSRRPFWENTKDFDKQVKSRIEGEEFFQSTEELSLMSPTLLEAQSFSFLGKMVSPECERYEKLHKFSSNKKNIAVKLNERSLGNLPGLISTNLGRLDFPTKYGELELERFIFAPSTGPALEMALAVATVGGRLTLTLNYIEEATDTPTMKAIMDTACRHLEIRST